MQQREPEVDADLWEAMSDDKMRLVLRQVGVYICVYVYVCMCSSICLCLRPF